MTEMVAECRFPLVDSRSVEVGTLRQLFVDGYVVESARGVHKTLHPAQKFGDGTPVLFPDKPWETMTARPAAVIYNPDRGLYEMWYYSYHFPHSILNISYACSDNGIDWEKPLLDDTPSLHWLYHLEDLRQVPELGNREKHSPDRIRAYYRGLPKNNIILGRQELQGVVYTPEDPDPNKRYKSAIFGGTLITSPDGIHWQIGNTFYPGQLNVFNYDPQAKLYFGFFIYPPYGVRGPDGTTRRALGYSCSHDLIHWTGSSPEDIKVALPLTGPEILTGYRGGLVRGKPVTCVEVAIAPDEQDDRITAERIAARQEAIWCNDPNIREAHFYGMSVMPYEGVYLGFPVKLDVCAHGRYGDDGPMQIELAFSRDLRHWRRDDRNLVLSNGAPNTWDGGMVQVANKPIVVGDEIWLYYGGRANTHGWPEEFEGYKPIPEDREEFDRRWKRLESPTSGISIAKWRLDGFVSIDAGPSGGELTTKPLVFYGRQLEINAAAPAGSIAVEIQDPSGRPLSSYALSDCDPLRGDSVHHLVCWKGKSDLTLLAGHAVRLKFALKDTSLYAFQFVGSGPSHEAVAVISQRPWQTVDLEREIEVGAEIASVVDGKRVALTGANKRCARCRLIIGEFEPVRIFKAPGGAGAEMAFHEQCVGKVRPQG